MMHPFQHRHSTILRRNGISVGVFIARIVLGSPEQRRHSLLLHPLAILALSAADLGQYAKNEMKEDAKDESSTGEDRNGNVLDGFRQSCQDLGRLGGAHGCSNDVCFVAGWCGFSVDLVRRPPGSTLKALKAPRPRQTSPGAATSTRTRLDGGEVVPAPSSFTCQCAP